ncbi:MAG: YnbE family lipoprotein [Pseudomonadales bacterium]|nr:YnbE family lipoprotein [Pseudomonadales bacterium]
MAPWRLIQYGIMVLLLTTACIPTVQVAVPDKPITINLNIKIEHEIKVKVDKELDELFADEEEVF